MIGIIAAMEMECSLLREALSCGEEERVCGLSFYEGKLNERNVVLVQCGVGKVNASMAATILISHYECDLLINTGIAGGLVGVQTEDIILGTKLVYSDVDVSCFGYALGQVPGLPLYFTPHPEVLLQFKRLLNHLKLSYREATIYTADRFVTKPADVLSVGSEATVVTEMEGTAIAQVCVRSGIPFMVLRYVSDQVGQPSQIKDYQEFEAEMARRSSKICLEIIKNWE